MTFRGIDGQRLGSHEIEHYAINAEDPVAVADWYVAHCEMSIALSIDRPPYM